MGDFAFIGSGDPPPDILRSSEFFKLSNENSSSTWLSTGGTELSRSSSSARLFRSLLGLNPIGSPPSSIDCRVPTLVRNEGAILCGTFDSDFIFCSPPGDCIKLYVLLNMCTVFAGLLSVWLMGGSLSLCRAVSLKCTCNQSSFIYASLHSGDSL